MPLIILGIMAAIELIYQPRLTWSDDDCLVLIYGRKSRKFIKL